MDWEKIVPERYWRGDDHPKAETVGELVRLLEELPAELPVKSGLGDRVQLIVSGISDDARRTLFIEEPDDPEDDYCDWYDEEE